MKQMNALKLTIMAASVAALGVGCASSGYARYDADSTKNSGTGVSASAQTGTDRETMTSRHHRSDADMAINGSEAGEGRVTVSALAFNPETRANWVNKFPFYDTRWQTRSIDLYTFAVPDPTVSVASNDSDLPQFSVNLPPGSVFVESAGGAGEVRAGRVIQHSPNPR